MGFQKVSFIWGFLLGFRQLKLYFPLPCPSTWVFWENSHDHTVCLLLSSHTRNPPSSYDPSALPGGVDTPEEEWSQIVFHKKKTIQ